LISQLIKPLQADQNSSHGWGDDGDNVSTDEFSPAGRALHFGRTF
jgi:hypothetical protein